MSEEKKKNRTVTILAVNNNYRIGMPFYMVPVYSQATKEFYTGLEESLDPDISAQKRGRILKAMGVSAATVEELRVPINHGQILDLSKEEDFGTYKLALVSEHVANSQRLIDADNHLFYLSDPEGEAGVNLTQERLVIEAKSKILDEGGDFEKLRALALFLGSIELVGLSLNVVLDRLLKEAGKNPQKVIDFYKGGHGHHVMIKELQFYNIISLTEGKFMDGEKYLGTLNEAIAFVANPNNTDYTNSLAERLIKAKTNK